MVAIHGRWCGPNWTDGRNISARDYKLQGGDFKGPCVDAVDCACRTHDRECSGSRGCSSGADLKLARVAQWQALITIDPILKVKYQAIANGMVIASATRRR